MDRSPALGPLLAAALWGGMYVVSKWGFAAVPPLTLAFLRVALGAGTLVVLVRVTAPRRSFSDADRRRFVVLGGWVTLTMATQFLGTDLTSASQGSVLTVLTPVFTFLLGAAALDEPVSSRRVAGLALATLGTGIVLAGRYDLARVGSGNLAGVALLLAASAGWAAYTVYGAPLVRRYSALETATYSTVAAVPMLAVFVPAELAVRDGPVVTGPVTPALVAAVLYLGVLSTAAAWYFWYSGLESLDAGAVAVYFFVQPVVGTALGVALLDEPLSPGFVLGGLVMCAGIYVVSVSGRREHEERLEPEGSEA